MTSWYKKVKEWFEKGVYAKADVTKVYKAGLITEKQYKQIIAGNQEG